MPERDCLTPGCVYTLAVSAGTVAVAVTLPAALALAEPEAAALEGQLHDAVEGVLSRLPFFATADAR